MALGGGCYIPLYGQILQKRLYFYVARLFGVALAMEGNVLSDPEKIRFLRALGIMFQLDLVPHLIKEFSLLCHARPQLYNVIMAGLSRSST